MLSSDTHHGIVEPVQIQQTVQRECGDQVACNNKNAIRLQVTQAAACSPLVALQVGGVCPPCRPRCEVRDAGATYKSGGRASNITRMGRAESLRKTSMLRATSDEATTMASDGEHEISVLCSEKTNHQISLERARAVRMKSRECYRQAASPFQFAAC